MKTGPRPIPTQLKLLRGNPGKQRLRDDQLRPEQSVDVPDPPGFITESFDALGRERTEEKLFDAQGNVLASLPVDTSAVPAVQPGDGRAMSTAAELTRAIDGSGLYHSCLGRHYFRFAQGRVEDPARDGCLLSKLESAARSNAPLTDVLKTVARDATFTAKRFE